MSRHEQGIIQPRGSEILIAGRPVEVARVAEHAWRVDVRNILEGVRPDWDKEVVRVAELAPEKVIRGGSINTSFASADFKTVYHPTNGELIKRDLPWLLALYQGDFQKIVQFLSQDPSAELGTDLAHSLNMNLTRAGGYEPHVDRNKWTFLLGATTMEEGEGGETILWRDTTFKEEVARVRPVTGYGVVFAGNLYPHEVTPFTPKNVTNGPRKVRVTVPGDYYTADLRQEVDEAFNDAIGVGHRP